MKNKFLTTLFVGIDVGSQVNAFHAMSFYGENLLIDEVTNNKPGTDSIIKSLIDCLNANDLKRIVIAFESTSIYSTHVASSFSSDTRLLPYDPHVYCLNPKTTASYRKTFVDMDVTDGLDAYLIADFARCGKITSKPWRGAQFLALQRLTRHRLHLIRSVTREKTYMTTNIYLKFSELATMEKDEHPFSNIYGATSTAVLTEFFSLDEIAYSSMEDLIAFVSEKSRNRFSDPHQTAKLLKKAARDSYRLDKVLYEPLNVALASSFNIMRTFEQEIKVIDKAIKKCIKGLNNTEYQSLISIPGIGPVLTSGILAEIGTITAFDSHNALAKFAGLTWRTNQSGKFKSDETRMTKTGNKYLRYYLIEAANSVKNHTSEYKQYYYKKYNEATTHKHKRALALTSRKLVRLIFSLLTKNQIYSSSKVGEIK